MELPRAAWGFFFGGVIFKLGSAKKVIACVATRVKRDLIVAHSLGHLAQRKDSTIECIKFFMTLRVFI